MQDLCKCKLEAQLFKFVTKYDVPQWHQFLIRYLTSSFETMTFHETTANQRRIQCAWQGRGTGSWWKRRRNADAFIPTFVPGVWTATVPPGERDIARRTCAGAGECPYLLQGCPESERFLVPRAFKWL